MTSGLQVRNLAGGDVERTQEGQTAKHSGDAGKPQPQLGPPQPPPGSVPENSKGTQEVRWDARSGAADLALTNGKGGKIAA